MSNYIGLKFEEAQEKEKKDYSIIQKQVIQKNGYFEEDIKWIDHKDLVKKCKDCLCAPIIVSVRERENNLSVKLIGIKIICGKCQKQVMKNHCSYRGTLHPDDSTITIARDEWNEKNNISIPRSFEAMGEKG